jgi:glycosyltransferase involved in cell wall biosynthesis
MAKQNSRIKILFILPSLTAGGAQRVISFIATNLNKQKFNSILIVIGKAEDAVFTTKGIEVLFLNKKRVLTAIPKLFRYIFILKPKIVVGSISHVNRVIAVFSLFFPKTKFIGREASVLSIMNKFPTVKRKFSNPFFKKYHKYLDAIICQSKDMLDDLKINYAVSKNKMFIINNPISENFSVKEKRFKTNKIIQLITIGRLSKEKGHLRLLNIIAKLDIPYHYTIIGTGSEEEQIHKLAQKLNISINITYIPHTNNVAKYLAESDLFLQGSYVEGFPNVLLESCAVGTPVIAFEAPGGTKEIILENVNGCLVKNEQDYINCIKQMTTKNNFDPIIVSQTVQTKYSKDIIIKKYEKIFKQIVSN